MHATPQTAARWIASLLLAATAGAAAARAGGRDTAAIQVALDRSGFSVGCIDNRDGGKTLAALTDYRRSLGLPGAEARLRLLADREPPFRFHTVSTQDLQQIGVTPEDWLDASQCSSLPCESLEEWMGERYHVKPSFLHELNPEVPDWNRVAPGTRLLVPNVKADRRLPAAASVLVDCGEYRIRAFDATGRLVASFPCSIARDLSRVPVGDLRTVSFAPNPVYVFDPANYAESARAQEIGRKLILPPGPNSPVGAYWIGLSAPGFGIHGTRHPETIGTRESHGCFRLTNWDAVTLAGMLRTGVSVTVALANP